MSRTFVLLLVVAFPACMEARVPSTAPPLPAPAIAKPAEKKPVEPPKAVPKQPVYDLAADVQARKAEAVRDLGKRTETDVIEGVFVVAAPGGKGALVGAIDVTRRSLAAYFNGRFRKRPEKAISVYLFPTSVPYEAYCQKRWQAPCTSPYGSYMHSDRRIVMNVGPGIGTLTHELVHPLVETDFPEAPDWINEGIASLFEQFHLPRPGEIRGSKNWRLPRLKQAMSSKSERELARVPALFGMTDDVFRGDKESLNYATARYLCQWLDQKNLLWPFYQRWRDDFEADPSGEKAFAAVVGKTPAEVHDEWARWVRAL